MAPRGQSTRESQSEAASYRSERLMMLCGAVVIGLVAALIAFAVSLYPKK